MNGLHALSLSFVGAQLSLVAARGTLLPLGLAVAAFLMLHSVLVIFTMLTACLENGGCFSCTVNTHVLPS